MIFNQYSNYYDSLYTDKDNDAECDFVESILKRFSGSPIREILDLGCGMGGHAIPFAMRGYSMTGVDPSLEISKHIIDVDYTLKSFDGVELQEELHESHNMGLIFVPDVQLLCKITDSNFCNIASFEPRIQAQ